MIIYIVGSHITINKFRTDMPYGQVLMPTEEEVIKHFLPQAGGYKCFRDSEEAEKYCRENVIESSNKLFAEKCQPVFKVIIKNFFLEKSLISSFDSQVSILFPINLRDIFLIEHAVVCSSAYNADRKNFYFYDNLFTYKTYYTYSQMLPAEFTVVAEHKKDVSLMQLQPLIKKYLNTYFIDSSDEKRAKELNQELKSDRRTASYFYAITLIYSHLRDLVNTDYHYCAMLKAMVNYLENPLFYCRLVEQLTSIPKESCKIIFEYVDSPLRSSSSNMLKDAPAKEPTDSCRGVCRM